MIIAAALRSVMLFLPLWVMALLLYAAYTDCVSRTISNSISFSIAPIFGVFWMIGGSSQDVLDHLMVATGMMILLLPLFFLGKMGGGDVKLITVTALWVGPEGLSEFLIYMTFGGALLALVLMSFFMRSVWEWGVLNLRLNSARIQFSNVSGVPYGIAIAAGGTVTIFKQYVI